MLVYIRSSNTDGPSSTRTQHSTSAGFDKMIDIMSCLFDPGILILSWYNQSKLYFQTPSLAITGKMSTVSSATVAILFHEPSLHPASSVCFELCCGTLCTHRGCAISSHEVTCSCHGEIHAKQAKIQLPHPRCCCGVLLLLLLLLELFRKRRANSSSRSQKGLFVKI